MRRCLWAKSSRSWLCSSLPAMPRNANRFLRVASNHPFFGPWISVPSNVTSEQSGKAATTPVGKNRPGAPSNQAFLICGSATASVTGSVSFWSANDCPSASMELSSSRRIARRIRFWMGYRLADEKVARSLANMVKLLLWGDIPAGPLGGIRGKLTTFVAVEPAREP